MKLGHIFTTGDWRTYQLPDLPPDTKIQDIIDTNILPLKTIRIKQKDKQP